MASSTSNRLPGSSAAALLVVLFIVAGCHEAFRGGPHGPTAPRDTVIGSGNVVQELRDAFGFAGVRLVGAGRVEIEQGEVEGLVVEAEDNLLQYLTTEVIGGVLVISEDPNVTLQPTRPVIFRVGARTMESLELVGVGDIRCSELSGERLRVSMVGVGQIDLFNLTFDEVEVTLTGVGDVNTSGTTRMQRVSMTGPGSYDARHLASRDAIVDLLSAGSATLRVRDRLVATVVGSGCVYYIGNPEVESLIQGVGCVRQIE